jgi:hypothetical protein
MNAEAQGYMDALHTHWEQIRVTIEDLPAAALNWRPLEHRIPVLQPLSSLTCAPSRPWWSTRPSRVRTSTVNVLPSSGQSPPPLKSFCLWLTVLTHRAEVPWRAPQPTLQATQSPYRAGKPCQDEPTSYRLSGIWESTWVNCS